jgi:ribonuclease HI
MAGKKQKYYVVWEGRKPGIYTSWVACKAEIDGYKGARYKAFESRTIAEQALAAGADAMLGKPKPKQAKLPVASGSIIRDSISVDAACSGNPGVMEYQGVETATGEIVFHKGPFPEGTNNIGEFLAIVHALALMKQNDDRRPVYTDSRTALSWVKHKRVKTMLDANPRTQKLWHLIRRAEKWLEENTWPNRLLKWDTERWGEIPADFGRK